MVLMAAMLYAATPTTWGNVVTVKLTDGNNDTYQSRFGTSPELSDEAGWGAVPTNLDGATVRAYLTLGAVNYEQLFLKSMKNVPLVIKTYNSATMTIKLTGNEGSAVLYDIQENAQTSVAKGETNDYVCTVATNATISDRFVLFYEPIVVTPSICFSNNTLDVLGHAGKTLSVKKVDGTDVIAEQVLASDAEHFDLKTLVPADTRLVVTLDGTAYQIDVNPTVTTL